MELPGYDAWRLRGPDDDDDGMCDRCEVEQRTDDDGLCDACRIWRWSDKVADLSWELRLVRERAATERNDELWTWANQTGLAIVRS